MPTKKPRNLDDLARQAGVTVATVSMALRNSPLVAGPTRERINLMAREVGFTPRPYTRKHREHAVKHEDIGPILILKYEIPGRNCADPVQESLSNALFLLMNERKIEYRYMDYLDVAAEPSILEEFRGVVYYNDLPEEAVPEMPAVQIFGWNPHKRMRDRITANDAEVVELAIEHLCRMPIDRAAITWCREMVELHPNHPRITGFLEKMKTRGCEVTALDYARNEPDYLSMVKCYIENGGDRIGFFAFNAECGLKLCCALESLGVLKKYAEAGLIICDNSPILSTFMPAPVRIDLNMPMMVEYALDTLTRRILRPELPEVTLLQSPRLLIS